MTWKAEILLCIEQYCIENQTPFFTLEDMYKFVDSLALKYPNNNYIEDKIRQQLQFLRNEGLIQFIDNNGSYKLAQSLKDHINY